MAKLLTAGAFTLAAVALTGCSKSHDAWFANPCPQSLSIRTLYVQRGTDATKASDEVIASATLEPTSVTKVEDAFQDASGFTWFVQVDNGPTLRFQKDDMPEWFVALPASVCAATVPK